MTNKNLQAIVKELFIKYRKLNISLAFITQPCFSVSKEVRLNSTHYLIMKIHKRKSYKILLLIIQQIMIIKILWRFTKNILVNHILLLTIDTTLPAKDPLTFRKNLLLPYITWHYRALTDEFKFFHDKIKAHWAQHGLNREVAKIYHLKNWISMNIWLVKI